MPGYYSGEDDPGNQLLARIAEYRAKWHGNGAENKESGANVEYRITNLSTEAVYCISINACRNAGIIQPIPGLSAAGFARQGCQICAFYQWITSIAINTCRQAGRLIPFRECILAMRNELIESSCKKSKIPNGDESQLTQYEMLC